MVAPFGPSWNRVGIPFGGHLGLILGYLGPYLPYLGLIFWGPSWAYLDPILGHLGLRGNEAKNAWRLSENTILEVSGEQLEAILDNFWTA